MVNTVYPPFINAPDHPLGQGMDVEIAQSALDRAGYEMRLQLVPWKRALLMLENGDADLTSTISRRDDRDRYLAWSQPYRLGANYCFYARRDSELQLRSLDDLRGRSLGVVSGFHYPPPLVSQPGQRLIPGRDVRTLVQMLKAGRSDFIVATAIAGAWEIRERGLGVELQRMAYEYTSDSPNYLAFSRARPQATAALLGVDTALQAMQRDGSLARIERKYRP